MRKTLISLIGIATIAVAPLAISKAAHAGDGGAIAAGIIGGLAAGAIIGSAANGGYYGPAPAYYGAYGPAPGCYMRRERVWDGFAWRLQRVRVCY